MISKKRILITITALFSTGCAHHSVHLLDEVVRLDQPHRIIKHDFRHKYDVVSAIQPLQATPVKKAFKKNELAPSPLAFVDIEFNQKPPYLSDQVAVVQYIKT